MSQLSFREILIFFNLFDRFLLRKTAYHTLPFIFQEEYSCPLIPTIKIIFINCFPHLFLIFILPIFPILPIFFTFFPFLVITLPILFFLNPPSVHSTFNCAMIRPRSRSGLCFLFFRNIILALSSFPQYFPIIFPTHTLYCPLY